MFIGGNGGFDEIRKKIEVMKKNAVNQKLLRRLQYIAEDVLNDARKKGSYMDRTGNLRSSIGCRIYHNGKPIHSYKVQLVGNCIEPDKRLSLEELQSNFDEAMNEYAAKNVASVEGYTIVLIAGMDYAYYVEAKGYNVLHESNNLLQQKVNELKAELNSK
jgi:hypothetical protein